MWKLTTKSLITKLSRPPEFRYRIRGWGCGERIDLSGKGKILCRNGRIKWKERGKSGMTEEKWGKKAKIKDHLSSILEI